MMEGDSRQATGGQQSGRWMVDEGSRREGGRGMMSGERGTITGERGTMTGEGGMMTGEGGTMTEEKAFYSYGGRHHILASATTLD